MILALTPEKEVVMVRQYRHGSEQVCLELLGGLVEPDNDSPALSAGRELLEETGYKANEIMLILIQNVFLLPYDQLVATVSDSHFFRSGYGRQQLQS